MSTRTHDADPPAGMVEKIVHSEQKNYVERACRDLNLAILSAWKKGVQVTPFVVNGLVEVTLLRTPYDKP